MSTPVRTVQNSNANIGGIITTPQGLVWNPNRFHWLLKNMGKQKKIKSQCQRTDCDKELIPGMTFCSDHASKETLLATYLDCYQKFADYQEEAREDNWDTWQVKMQLLEKACSSERKRKGCNKKNLDRGERMTDEPECSHINIHQVTGPRVHWVCEDCGARLHPALRAVDTTQEYLPTVTRQHHTEMLMEKNNEINRLKAELKRMKVFTSDEVILVNLTKWSVCREEDGGLIVGGGEDFEHIFGPEEVCWFELKCYKCNHSWKMKTRVDEFDLKWTCQVCGEEPLLTIK
jgi:hypothetical protein